MLFVCLNFHLNSEAINYEVEIRCDARGKHWVVEEGWSAGERRRYCSDFKVADFYVFY